MSETVLAERYAQAFSNLTPDLEMLKKDIDYLKKWASFLEGYTEVSRLIENPVIPFSKKRKVLEQLDNFSSLSKAVQKYILYLVQKDRTGCLCLIIEQLEAEVDQKEGVLRGTLRVGRKLAESRREELIKSLGKQMGKKLEVVVEYDPSLLGGLILQTGNTVFDASIKNFLKKFLQDLEKGV